MRQLDFVCLKCVLADCLPDHPHCLYTLEGKVISRKTKVRKLRQAIKDLQARLDQVNNRHGRKAYYKSWYAQNRAKKIKSVKDYQRKKEEGLQA